MKYQVFKAELTFGPIKHTIDDVVVHPVCYTDESKEFMEQCDEDDPDIAFWTVYLHIVGGGLEAFADCPSKEQAEALRVWLILFAKNSKL